MSDLKELFVGLIKELPVRIVDIEARLRTYGCTMFSGNNVVKDYADRKTLSVDILCPHESKCKEYIVTRYSYMWLGIACGNSYHVAVFKDFVAVEKNEELDTVLHYELINVVADPKLYNMIKNREIVKTYIRTRYPYLLSPTAITSLALTMRTLIETIAEIYAYTILLRATGTSSKRLS